MNNAICDNIKQIINYVIQKELQAGKTLDQLKRKYTHGFCMSLATLIKSQFLDVENVRMFEFGRTYRKIELDGRYQWRGQVWHICVVVGELDELGKPLANAIVFDINGGRFFKDMTSYLTTQYPSPFDSNYVEDMAFLVDHNEYIIEDSVKPIELRKYEILREEEGVIEECYYDFLEYKKQANLKANNSSPLFVLLSDENCDEESGDV